MTSLAWMSGFEAELAHIRVSGLWQTELGTCMPEAASPVLVVSARTILRDGTGPIGGTWVAGSPKVRSAPS